MISRTGDKERGFTIVEGAIGLLIAGIIVAFAGPKISNAMREHRINIAMRQVTDLIKRAKMQAVSDNKKAGIAIDITNRKAGLVLYNDDGTVSSIQYMPLPDGVNFERSTQELASPPGVQNSAVVSFAAQSGIYRQDFNSRGFPSVGAGSDVVSVFLGNGKSYRAITMTSVGGIRTYRLENRYWVNTRETTNTSGG
jgi:Tfp pilus assembly protein FimT